MAGKGHLPRLLVATLNGRKQEGPGNRLVTGALNWVQGLDLNQRPSGYEPDELPGCSTLQQERADDPQRVGVCQRHSRIFPNSRLPVLAAPRVLTGSHPWNQFANP